MAHSAYRGIFLLFSISLNNDCISHYTGILAPAKFMSIVIIYSPVYVNTLDQRSHFYPIAYSYDPNHC